MIVVNALCFVGGLGWLVGGGSAKIEALEQEIAEEEKELKDQVECPPFPLLLSRCPTAHFTPSVLACWATASPPPLGFTV